MNRLGILHAIYREQKVLPFAWSERDCLAFCGLCAQAITGRDPTEALRSRYSSEIGAQRVMRQHGWSGLHDVALSFFPEIDLAMAQPGDWARVVNADGTESLGVVAGPMIAARAKASLGLVRLTAAQNAYRVI